MGKKLYVGNLSFKINENGLIELFSAYGSVETAKIVSDRDTGRSRGFAFVEMSSDTEAKAAIDALHGREQEGRQLTVSIAKPVTPRESRGGFRSSRY